MLQFKKGVVREGLQPVMLLALSRIERCFNEKGYSAVVTSTNEGYHSKRSLHYLGLAVDIRTNHISLADLEPLVIRLKETLYDMDFRFQVVLEKTHLHIEFDRRRP